MIKDDKVKSNIKLLIIKVFIIIVFLFITFYLIFGITVMNNMSMKPSIKEGGLLLYYRLDKNYKRGDVVVASINKKVSAYRVVATSNDTVNINSEGKLLINNHKENYDVFYNTFLANNSKIKMPYKVKSNEVFLLNDYRENADDSRLFGGVDKKNIKGIVIGKLQIRDF